MKLSDPPNLTNTKRVTGFLVYAEVVSRPRVQPDDGFGLIDDTPDFKQDTPATHGDFANSAFSDFASMGLWYTRPIAVNVLLLVFMNLQRDVMCHRSLLRNGRVASNHCSEQVPLSIIHEVNRRILSQSPQDSSTEAAIRE